MSRTKNKVASSTVTFVTTPQVVERLQELVSGGFYGKNQAEAAERIVARALESMVVDKKLSVPKQPV